MARKKLKYLSNAELLYEINESKKTYCYFIDNDYANYDLILDSSSEIEDPDVIERGKEARAKRLTTLNTRSCLISGHDPASIPKVLPKTIKPDEIVFRVMTHEHIPFLDETKNKYVNLPFPPFKHFILKDNKPFEVGRSHWQGGLENGNFCVEHGKITDRLADMYMKLITRYSTKPNWRGYCVDESTEALTQRGWLNIDEITTDDMILSCDNDILRWSKIKSIFRDNYDGKMFKVTTQRGIDMLITPGHKLVTENGPKPIELILESDRIRLIGSSEHGSNNKVYSDDFVELIGWIVTEGNYEFNALGLKAIHLWQNKGPYADRIRNCLKSLNYEFSESDSENIRFRLRKKDSLKVYDVIPDKNLTMEFILNLTKDQRELLINTMIDGDGYRTNGHRRYYQKSKEHIDIFQCLLALSGHRSKYSIVNTVSYGKETSYYHLNIFSPRKNFTRGECLNLHGGKNNDKTKIGQGKEKHPNFPTFDYNGRVWCPETEYGSFIARRGGTVYLTGNSYLDEMLANALLQFSAVALKFNEAKSENPFAWYTTVASNSFRGTLNAEKKNQNIRDELLIQSGATPSFAKQLSDLEDQALSKGK